MADLGGVINPPLPSRSDELDAGVAAIMTAKMTRVMLQRYVVACKIVFAYFRIAWTNITSRWSVSGLYRGGIMVCYRDSFVRGSFYAVFHHSCPSCVW